MIPLIATIGASLADNLVARASGPDYSFGSNYGAHQCCAHRQRPGLSIDGTSNPYATARDPYCVPDRRTTRTENQVTDADGNPVFERDQDGSYVCNPDTAPERVIAYRAENGLPVDAPVPVDAVTASGSGLDPHISVGNATIQAPRVAEARGIPLEEVRRLIRANTNGRAFGVLGEPGVNVLRLNLALDKAFVCLPVALAVRRRRRCRRQHPAGTLPTRPVATTEASLPLNTVW